MALWGKTDAENSKPKFLSAEEKVETFGVTPDEMTSEKAQGGTVPSHAGWVKVTTPYTDSSGNVRRKTEVLVAMGSMTGDLEDNVFQDFNISITTQPTNVSVTSPASLVFTTAAATTPAGGALTYQWMRKIGPGFNFEAIAGATSPTLTIASGNANYVNGYTFRCNISAPGAMMAFTNEVTATIAE